MSNMMNAPWRNRGVAITADMSVKQTLQAAGLDWPVEKAQNFLQVIGEPGKFRPNDDSFALVRGTDGHVLSPHVGAVYKPVQNEEAFEVFNDFVRVGNMHMDTAGHLYQGRMVWGLASLQQGFTLADGDEIKGYLLVYASHEYGHSLRVLFTPVRTVSMTTLVMALTRSGDGHASFAMSHARLFDRKRINEIYEVIGVARRQLAEFETQAKVLSTTEFDQRRGVQFLMSTMQPDLYRQCVIDGTVPKTLTELATLDGASRPLKSMPHVVYRQPGANMPGSKDTAWGYFNAVSVKVDHEHGRSDDTRLSNAWFGANAKLKRVALEEAMRIAATGKSSVDVALEQEKHKKVA